MHNKAQIMTWDVMVASSIFLLSFGAIYYVWNVSIIEMERSEKAYDMREVSTRSIEQLIRTPGVPEDWGWDEMNKSVIGLAKLDTTFGSKKVLDRVLDPEKVLSFIYLINTTYNVNEGIKYRLGIQDYEFYLKITCLNTTHCLSGFHVDIPDTNITCLNGKKFTIVNQTVVESPTSCTIGNSMIDDATDMNPATRTAALYNASGKIAERFSMRNQSIRLTLTVWE